MEVAANAFDGGQHGDINLRGGWRLAGWPGHALVASSDHGARDGHDEENDQSKRFRLAELAFFRENPKDECSECRYIQDVKRTVLRTFENTRISRLRLLLISHCKWHRDFHPRPRRPGTLLRCGGDLDGCVRSCCPSAEFRMSSWGGLDHAELNSGRVGWLCESESVHFLDHACGLPASAQDRPSKEARASNVLWAFRSVVWWSILFSMGGWRRALSVSSRWDTACVTAWWRRRLI